MTDNFPPFNETDAERAARIAAEKAGEFKTMTEFDAIEDAKAQAKADAKAEKAALKTNPPGVINPPFVSENAKADAKATEAAEANRAKILAEQAKAPKPEALKTVSEKAGEVQLAQNISEAHSLTESFDINLTDRQAHLIKVWGGGEHAKVVEIIHYENITGKNLDVLRAKCAGLDELMGQRGAF